MSKALTRPRFCRVCRQVLRGEGVCVHQQWKAPPIVGGMRAKAILDLTNPIDRSVLVETVWPAPVELWDSWSVMGILIATWWGYSLLGALGAVLFASSAAGAKPLYRNLRSKLRGQRAARTITAARGVPSAARGMLPAAKGEALEGVVQGGAPFPAPLSGRSCLAWAIALRTHEHIDGPLLLGEASNTAFELLTDAGQRVRVPAGLARLPEATTLCPGARAAVDAYLATLDPLRRGNDDSRSDPFPWTEACEDVVAAGDRIVVSGTFGERPDDTVAGTYRDHIPTMLVAQGPVAVVRAKP